GKTDGIQLQYIAHRVCKRRDAYVPRILRRAGMVRVFKAVQQRNVEMSDKANRTVRMREQFFRQRGDKILFCVRGAPDARIPMREIALRGCAVSKTRELEKQRAF